MRAIHNDVGRQLGLDHRSFAPVTGLTGDLEGLRDTDRLFMETVIRLARLWNATAGPGDQRQRPSEATQSATVAGDATVGVDTLTALRWLIDAQGYRHDYQAIVSWAVSGAPLPNPIKNTLDLFDIDSFDIKASPTAATRPSWLASILLPMNWQVAI